MYCIGLAVSVFPLATCNHRFCTVPSEFYRFTMGYEDKLPKLVPYFFHVIRYEGLTARLRGTTHKWSGYESMPPTTARSTRHAI